MKSLRPGTERKPGDDIAGRLIDFSVNIIKLTGHLPKSYAGNHIGGQLLRSGTSPGANYEEARGAQSRADFIHKMSIVLKELKESRYWLTLILKSQMTTHLDVKQVVDECGRLCAIIAQSIVTAKSKK